MFSCETVAHPYCALFINDEMNNENSYTVIRKNDLENFYEKINPIASQQQGDPEKSYSVMKTLLYCRVHLTNLNDELAINCLNERENKNDDGDRTMIECELCHVWYHEMCTKDQLYGRTLNYYDYLKCYDEKNKSKKDLDAY